MKLQPTWLLVATLAAAGCEGEEDPPSTNTDINFSMSYSLGIGQEQHVCQFVRMPETPGGEILVTAQTHNADFEHHWSIIRTNVTEVPQGFALDTPVDCFTSGISAFAGSALILEQKGQSAAALPPGTALPFKSGEILMLQIHALNTSNAAASGVLRTTMKTAAPGEPVQKLGLIQFYDPFIHVPAMGSGTAHARCMIPQEITLVQATTHFHERGRNEKVFVDLPGRPATSPLVESSSWEHPEVWNGSMVLPAGSSVHFTCSYENSDPVAYYQGQEKGANEMCMVLGFYYPALHDAAFEGCFDGFEHGTGTKSCGETSLCTQACPPSASPRPNGTLAIDVGPCFQKCIVDSCPSATAPLYAAGGCIEQNCATACAAGGPECGACIGAMCGREVSDCQSHVCGP